MVFEFGPSSLFFGFRSDLENVWSKPVSPLTALVFSIQNNKAHIKVMDCLNFNKLFESECFSTTPMGRPADLEKFYFKTCLYQKYPRVSKDNVLFTQNI